MDTLKANKSEASIGGLRQKEIEILEGQLLGKLLKPEDEGYPEACVIYNAMIDKKPALIAQCQNVHDVILSVNFARAHALLLAIRSGGHNGPGFGTCDGGLVIDLSPMKGIRVDPKNRTVEVGSGNTWGDVDHATAAFGMATVSGVISTTGVGGLTLGGGHGYLSRKYGLTIDNLLEADVVLADGSFVTANENQNSDLFWALRGGGGNFGVVTSFTYRLHPVGTIVGGPTLWPIDRMDEIMKWYRDFLPNADEDLSGFFAIMVVPPVPIFPEELHNKTVCGVVWCYSGTKESADKVFEPVIDTQPVLYGVQEMPYATLQKAFDALLPPGLQWYWKGGFVKDLADEAIKVHQKYASQVPTTLSTMHLYPIDGAVQRVGANETAWAYRDVKWSRVIGGIDPDPANNERMSEWAKNYWEELYPYSAGGDYINFMMDEGENRIRASYGDNYDRLVKIKTKYDPENLFRVNQNIKPSNP